MNYSKNIHAVTTVFTLVLLLSCEEEFEMNSSHFSEIDNTTNTIIYYGEKVGDFEKASANIDWTTVEKLIVQGHVNLNDVYDIRKYCKPKYGGLKDLNFRDADILEGTFDDLMFYSYEQLERFVYPLKMITTGNLVFKNCFFINEFTLPEEVEILGDGTVYNFCSTGYIYNGVLLERPVHDKEKYAIPAMVKELGKVCYMNYPLATIEIPDNVEKFGESCFLASKLESFTFPLKVTVVRKGMFSKCEKLKKVTLHNNITEIQESAFTDCSALEELVMPESVTLVKANFIKNTYNLKKIEWSPNITGFPDLALAGIAMEEVHIPETVTSLGRHCFFASISKRFYFHKDIDSFGEGLFNYRISNGLVQGNKSAIEELHVEWSIPPDAGNAFQTTVDFAMATFVNPSPDYSTVKLYVPQGSKEAYQNAEGWNLFGEIIEE